MRHDQNYQEAFGRHVRETRKSRNWAQLDLSIWSGVNETQISKIENGEVSPNLQTIRLLALALGIFPKDLLDFEYPLVLNTDFPSRLHKQPRVNTTARIRTLLKNGFFASPRSVSDITQYCKSNYDIDLASDDTSGVLLMLVKHGELKKVKSPIQGRNLYVKN